MAEIELENLTTPDLKRKFLLGALNGDFDVPGTEVDPSLIHVDDTIGKRVFIGDTMVYGDTGWRNVASLLREGVAPSSNIGVCHLRRIGDVVYFNFKLDVTIEGTGLFSPSFTDAWLPVTYYYFPVYSGPLATGASGLVLRDKPSYSAAPGVRFTSPTSRPYLADTTIVFSGSYPVAPGWPSALPGVAI